MMDDRGLVLFGGGCGGRRKVCYAGVGPRKTIGVGVLDWMLCSEGGNRVPTYIGTHRLE